MRKSQCAAAALLALCAVAQASTVAWYRFENGTPGEPAEGRKSVLDSSGNGLQGTPIDLPVYEAVDNPDSTVAMQFRGRKAHIHIHDAPVFQLTSMTLEAYVNVSALLGHQQQIVCRGSDDGILPWFLSITTDGRAAFLVAGSKRHSIVISPEPVPLNTWLSVAGTLDAATGTQSLYVNGALVATKTTTLHVLGKLRNMSHPGVAIGNARLRRAEQSFDGMLDEVRVSDVALDPSELLPAP